jgi:hypothetical protein
MAKLTQAERKRLVQAAADIENEFAFYSCTAIGAPGDPLREKYWDFYHQSHDPQWGNILDGDFYLLPLEERREIRVLMLLTFAEVG